MAAQREQHRERALLVHAGPGQHHRHERRQLHGASRPAAHGGGVDGGRVLIARACVVIAACSVAVTLGAQSPSKSGSSDSLHVCHAGSLLAAFTQVEDEFRKQKPDVKVVDTSGGSVDLVRRFAAGRLECDVIAPADHLVIETMLKPAKLVDYTIVFATGRMVLAYIATDPKTTAMKVSGSFNPPIVHSAGESRLA